MAPSKSTKQHIQKIISDYKKLTDVPILFIPVEQASSADSDSCVSLCAFCKLMQSSDAGTVTCMQQQRTAFQNADIDHSYHIFICHAGLWEWVVPIYFEKKLIGYFISGGVTCSECSASNIEDQENLYIHHFQIKPEEFQTALDGLKTIRRDAITPSAQLLLTLAQLHGLYEETADRRRASIEPSEDVINFMLDDLEATEELSVALPLSFYIDENNLDVDALSVFWKTIEVQSAEVFKNIMSAHFLEGRIAFEKIMQLALEEDSLRKAKASASMLYHIVTLKYFSKDFFDLRFYKLTFDTLTKISAVSSIPDIRLILTASYKHMYQMYNDTAPKKDASISQKIVKYLESNYDKDVTISRIASYLYLSPAYVSRLYRAETGFTIKKTLTSIRMRHAQELLLSSNMSIKDIGYSVGYKNDLRGFYKMFNSYFGMTCSEMRKRYGLASGEHHLSSSPS